MLLLVILGKIFRASYYKGNPSSTMSSIRTVEIARDAKLKIQHDRIEEKLKQKRCNSSLVQVNANRPVSAFRAKGDKSALHLETLCKSDHQVSEVLLGCNNKSVVVLPGTKTSTSFHDTTLLESDSDSDIFQTAAVYPMLNDTRVYNKAAISCEGEGKLESHTALTISSSLNVDNLQIHVGSSIDDLCVSSEIPCLPSVNVAAAECLPLPVLQIDEISGTPIAQDTATAWSDACDAVKVVKHLSTTKESDSNFLDSANMQNSVDTRSAPKYPLFVMKIDSNENNAPAASLEHNLWLKQDADKCYSRADNVLKQDVGLSEDIAILRRSNDKQSKSTIDDSNALKCHQQNAADNMDKESSSFEKHSNVDFVSGGDSNDSFVKGSSTSASYDEYRSKVNDLYAKHDLDITDFHNIQLPIPKHCIVKCRLERTRNRLLPIIHLYLDQTSNSRLLLSARRERTVANNYIIAENSLCTEENCIAKVRCNLWLNQYSVVIFDGVTSLPKPVDVWTEKASIVYKYRSRTNCPRKLKVVLPALNASTSNSSTPQSYASLLQQSELADCSNVIVLHNKIPHWSNEDQAYTLLCQGRVKMASVKTFQLISPDNGDIVLQFGRWDENAFTLDFTHPLSLIQAFGIALSAFNGKPFV